MGKLFTEQNHERKERESEKEIGINLKMTPMGRRERGERERTLIIKSFCDSLQHVKF